MDLAAKKILLGVAIKSGEKWQKKEYKIIENRKHMDSDEKAKRRIKKSSQRLRELMRTRDSMATEVEVEIGKDVSAHVYATRFYTEYLPNKDEEIRQELCNPPYSVKQAADILLAEIQQAYRRGRPLPKSYVNNTQRLAAHCYLAITERVHFETQPWYKLFRKVLIPDNI